MIRDRIDCIELSAKTADALDELVCPVACVNVDLPSMAWLSLVCRHLPDEERYFPKGKWATLQHIDSQLDAAALGAATEAQAAAR